jgi:hypothetical protein
MEIELAPIFQIACDKMDENRLAFNQADSINANHGDHMVEIFTVAVKAAREKQAEGLAEAMDYAGLLLDELQANASAHVYGRGIKQLGEQFNKYAITLDDLVAYMQKALKEENKSAEISKEMTPEVKVRSKEVLKALVAALAGWRQSENGQGKAAIVVDLSYMFDLGVAYMQAKQRNTTRIEVIADAAASVSPLSSVPYRYESGKLAIATLLGAMAKIDF